MSSYQNIFFIAGKTEAKFSLPFIRETTSTVDTVGEPQVSVLHFNRFAPFLSILQTKMIKWCIFKGSTQLSSC